MNNERDEKESFLFYRWNEWDVKIQVVLESWSVWVSQNSMADIFNTSKQNISYHINNIFQEWELNEKTVVKEILTTASDGKDYNTNFYNLDAIISVGYRISSYKATQFRIWATSIIKDYSIKWFVLNDERLKQGTNLFGEDYFEELLDRIREIRASERRFYQKITDLYTTAIDYDASSPITRTFYATVQNKLHWAIHHHTASELIVERVDHKKTNMWLTNWKNSKVWWKILKWDISVAKNYLTKEEIEDLNRVVSMYLDFAENMARKRNPMKMIDWVERLDSFLEFNEYDILKNPWKITAQVAKKVAEKHFSKFRIIQDKNYESDFDKIIWEIKSEIK